MTYNEIIGVLPRSVAVELQENLDSIELTTQSTADEVGELIHEATKLTKLGDAYLHGLDDEKRRMVDAFFEMLPAAGARALYA